MLNRKHFLLSIVVLLTFSLFAFTNFFLIDFTENYQAVDYVKEYSVSLSDAHFPVYWFKNSFTGLGSPLPSFVSPLPALSTASFMVLGFSGNLVLSLYISFIFLLAGYGWFHLALNKLSEFKSILLTIFVLILTSIVLLPRTYTSLTQITFISILPVFLKISGNKSKNNLALQTLVSSILILTNHVLFITCLGLFFITAYANQTLTLFIKSLLFSLLVTAFFWVPLLSEFNQISKTLEIKNTNNNESFYSINGNANITEEVNKTGEKFVQLNHKELVKFKFNSLYYHGWKFYVNDIQIEPELDQKSLPSAQISPEGGDQKNVKLILENTPIKSVSIFISLIFTTLFLFLLIYNLVGHNASKAFGIVAGIIFIFNISLALIGSENKFQTFDPKFWETKYLQSQWVDPQSKHPIGDHGLYAWAGWAYYHGENPILINSEMPPLGKYIIGLLLTLTKSAFATGVTLSAFMFLGIYLLGKKILANSYLATIPLALLSFERIITSSLTLTMLDGLQLGFLSFYFYFLIDAKKWKHFILASLMVGGVLTTKFYASGVLVIMSTIFYYVLTANWSKLFKYTVSLPLAALVHLLSYTRYFILGGNLRGYFGVQKYILNFYGQGGPRVPFGSYWLLVFFNKWRVWWGPTWGEFYTLTTKEWRLTWPLGAVSSLFAIFLLFKRSLFKFKGKIKNIPDFYLIVSWLLAYSSFLSLIGGWPHYMMLFLPFSAIVAIKLIVDYHHYVSKKLSPFLTKIYSYLN